MIQFDEHILQMGGEKPPTTDTIAWLNPCSQTDLAHSRVLKSV